MERITVHPKTKEQAAALKAFFKALRIKYEVEKSPYSYEFVAEVRQAEKEIK